MPPPNGVAEIENLIERHGLQRVKKRIIDSSKPSVELRLNRPDASPAPGASRLGGMPDLPSADLWPTLGRAALTFIGQINLADLRRDAGDRSLPSDGILSFFYDVEGMADAEFSSRGAWRVLYFPGAAGLTHIDQAPRTVPITLPAQQVSFVPTITVPTMRSIEIEPLELSESELEKYWEFRNSVLALYSRKDPLHRMLGHPDGIQGCMQRTVQFVSRGLTLPEGVYSYYEHPRAAELIPGAHDWRLLLQIDSDDRLGCMWGDDGRIYYWIHKDDLLARDFSRIWVFMQCY